MAVAIIPSLITGEWHKWIYTALTFLVISCPCALVLSVPLAFFSGIGNASKHGILLKGGRVIEAKIVRPNDLVITMGAGSINQYGPKLLAILEEGLQ